MVSLGRYAWGCAPGRLAAEDRRAVNSALAACDLLEMAERRTDRLSGGELARVHCARAFATEAPLLFADEPVASLDPRHRFRIMELIRGQVRTGAGALVVLHDVSLAARFADRLIWMKDGRIVAGRPADGNADRIANGRNLPGQGAGCRRPCGNRAAFVISALWSRSCLIVEACEKFGVILAKNFVQHC